MDISTYHLILWIMAVMGLFVFIALYFVDAGYGKFRTNRWGYSIDNKIGWVLMEAPALVPVIVANVMFTPNRLQLLFMGLYALHYVYRSFIFPSLLKGKSRMPLAIIAMGAGFNTMNSSLLCASIVLFPKDTYTDLCHYAQHWYFWVGIVLFFLGMYTHMKADHTIRNLRKPGDTNHYLPKGGMFDYVTSANYLGEITEWLGFAILTWSWAGLSFFWFSCCNLVPRANSIYHRYKKEFAGEFDEKKLKRIIPFIY